MRRLFSPVALLTVLALILTGCGGGGSGQTAAPVSSAPGAGSGIKTNAVLKLTIPAASTASAAARQPATVSAQTQSVAITVNTGTPQIFNVAALQCTTSLPITCTLTVQAIVGNDTFLINTYSGTNGTGTLLNQATLAFTVVLNGANTLTAVLGDVVSSLADSGAGSLRAVVAAATPGDIITFAQGLTGTITLTSGPIVLTHNVTISGSAATTMTVSGGNTSQVFTVNTGVTATLSAFTVANGKNDTGGGVLNNGTLTVANMTFANNTTASGNAQAYDGGAIANEGTLTVTGGTFTGNTSPQEGGEGGAIYSDVGATLTVTNATFSGNSAQWGGAIGSESTNATIGASTFTNNTAVSPTTGDYTFGGAVYSEDDITISGSTFTGNVSGGNAAQDGLGGAVVEDGFTTTGLALSTSTFTSNKAGVPSAGDHSGQGGALYDDSGDTAVLTANTFGGSSNTGNVAGGVDTDSSGGAVAIDYVTSLTLAAGNTFSFNSVSSQTTLNASGGGAVELTSQALNLAITGVNTFANNSVTAGPPNGNGSIGGYAVGGALDIESNGTIDLSAASGTTFTNNSASATDPMGSAFGGAIEYFGTVQVQQCCKGTAIGRRNGQAIRTPAQRPRPPGRAAPQTGPHGSAKANARHAAFAARRASGTRRTATLPAAAYTLNGITFTGNTVTGGSASAYGAVGGAFDLEQNTNAFAINNSTFSSNTSNGGQSSYAGGLFEAGGGVIVTGTQFTNNTAPAGAGGIEVNDGGSLSLINCTVTGNRATAVAQGGAGGGGIISGLSSSLYISGSTIANNSMGGTTVNSGGGGIEMWSNNGGTAQIQNSTIYGNTSSVDGGGIETLAAYTVTLTNVTVYGNHANSGNGNGGNLYNEANITLENTIVAFGTATTGADIVNNGIGTAFFGTNGGNLIGATSGTVTGSGSFGAVPLGATPDLTGVDPHLLPLASNGGLTQTMADQTTSPGKGYVPFTAGICGRDGPSVDQRNKNRGTNGVCDIGAYEFAGF